MDASTVSAAISGLRLTTDFLRNAANFREGLDRGEERRTALDRIIAAQGALLDSQADRATLQTELEKAEAQVKELVQWDQDKARYELQQIENGALVYSLKASEAGTDPPHHLCPNCYTSNVKAILQPEIIAVGRLSSLRCLRCQSVLLLNGARDFPVSTPRVDLGPRRR